MIPIKRRCFIYGTWKQNSYWIFSPICVFLDETKAINHIQISAIQYKKKGQHFLEVDDIHNYLQGLLHPNMIPMIYPANFIVFVNDDNLHTILGYVESKIVLYGGDWR